MCVCVYIYIYIYIYIHTHYMSVVVLIKILMVGMVKCVPLVVFILHDVGVINVMW